MWTRLDTVLDYNPQQGDTITADCELDNEWQFHKKIFFHHFKMSLVMHNDVFSHFKAFAVFLYDKQEVQYNYKP